MTHESLKEMKAMEESTTYQEIVSKSLVRGHLQGERDALLRVARRRLGEPSQEATTAIEAISSVERVEFLLDRVLQVESWDELLA